MQDLEYMSVGMVMDYFEDYADIKTPKDQKEPAVRKATQADFDAF